MRALVFLVKLLLKIAVAPVIVALTLFVWICVGIVYISGLVLGLISMVVALLGVAVLITYSPQNGIILLGMAFLISPYGLPSHPSPPLSFQDQLNSSTEFRERLAYAVQIDHRDAPHVRQGDKLIQISADGLQLLQHFF